MISGRECLRPALNASFFPPPPKSHPEPNHGRASDIVGWDYSNCTVRCWGHVPGYSFSGALNEPQDHLEAHYYIHAQDNTDACVALFIYTLSECPAVPPLDSSPR